MLDECVPDYDYQSDEEEATDDVMYTIEGDFENYIDQELSGPMNALRNLPEN